MAFQPVPVFPQVGGETLGRQGNTPAGRVVGRVLNAENAAPIQGAQVFLLETRSGGLTDFNGRYVILNAPVGDHQLQVQMLGFATKTVTGLKVEEGTTAVLDIQMDPSAIELEAITVSAVAERGTTTTLLTERKLSAAVSDAIGRDQMERSPDGDAAAALKRLPGLSVVDGRFAYVRGLGERYSSTTLNDAPLASPVPDKKVIPLDLFPSSLLESIVADKSYSPDQPGDFAGGLVRLKTRVFPPERVLRVSAGTGWNSAGTFQDGLDYDAGSRLDFLGFGDGPRDLPELIPSDRRVNVSNFSGEDLQKFGRSFTGAWGPSPQTVPVNSSFGVSFGDDLDFSQSRRLGFLASANYSNSYDVRLGQVERVFAQSGVDDPEVDYLADMTTRSVQWGGLLSLTFQPDRSNQISFSGLYNRLVDDLARQLEGFNLDSNTNQRNTRIQYIATAMQNYQLSGTHTLGFLSDLKVDWRGAFTSATRFEPNTRDVLYREYQGTYLFDDFVQSGSIFHQDQMDEGWNGAAAFTLPFVIRAHPASLAVGVATDRKDRSTQTRRFRFRPYRGGDLTDGDLALPPDELFAPQNVGPLAFEIQESTFREDNYEAGQEVDAAFVKVDAQILPRLRVTGGVRVEQARQTVDPIALFETGQGPLVGAELNDTDLLPALNLTVQVGDQMNLKASASRTLARPELRELAPFSFADYAGGYLTSGNPTLTRSRILNYDLRWEWFPSYRSVVAISGFYKSFENPIEVLVLPSTELIRSWVNAREANNYGAEVELRTDLGFLAPALQDLEFNGNFTLVESEVDAGGVSTVYIPNQGPFEIRTIDRARALQGQSPYVLNLGLTWAGAESGTRATVLFNSFGERIDAVGREESPDIYEEARNQLDLVLEHPLRGVDVKLSLTRLLGNEVTFTQGGETLRRYDLGRSLSLSLGWSPGW